jgi:hypothetical protein
MEIYALAAAAAFPGREVALEVEFLRAGGARRPLALDLEAAGRRVRAAATRLSAALAAPAAAAFPPAFAEPDPCRRLGCGYVSRCFRRSRVVSPSGVG